MNPVAFINVEERKLEWATPMTWNTPTIAKMDKVPLYTLKELTNDEIMQVATATSWSYQNWSYFQIDFARAILEKASEK